ncbi:hypothetical protein [Falsiroseomonas sp. HW251]|uniref:hypothetical protein n=1 Tax=Falsiroseomonas sp. HW251 TaxID=3390998 RepID=UPI003D316421
MKRRALILLPLAACAGPQGPALPTPSSLRGSGDPPVAAIGNTAFVFGRPGSLAGRPADAADAIAQLEWLAVVLATDQRFTAMPPLVQPGLRSGRDEVRAAFGVPLDYPAPDAVAGFDAVAESLHRFDVTGAELAMAYLVGRARVPDALAMLNYLPPFRRAASGTAQAQIGLSELVRRGGG